jgi:ribose transport system substrate-binding protein
MVLLGLRRSAAMLMVAACVAAAGCGENSSSSDSSSSKSGSGTAASSAAAQAGLAAAQRDVRETRRQPSTIGITQPLSKSPAGKTVAIVVCGAPICAAAVPDLKAPLEMMKMKVKTFNAGVTPGSISAALNSVVQSKPGVVVDFAVPGVLWKSQLSQLAESKTPVILAATDPPPGQEGDVAATFFGADKREQFGKHLANMVIADSGGKGKSMYVWTPELTGLKPQTDAFLATTKKNCPACTVDVVTTKSSDIGKKLPQQVVSELQRKPDTKYVVMMSGDMVTGVPEAMKSAGLSGVKVISSAGSPVNYAYINRNQQYADLAGFLPVYLWQIADSAARGAGGAPMPAKPAFFMQWIQQSNSPAKGPPAFGSDFTAEFKKLWGVT